MNPNGPIREEFQDPAGFGGGTNNEQENDLQQEGDTASTQGFPLEKKSVIEPGTFKTFEEAGLSVEPENTDKAEVAKDSEEFESEAPVAEVFATAKDIAKKLEGSSEFKEMKSLVGRRENALVEITTTQQELIKVKAKVKRVNQELKDAEDLRTQSLELAKDDGAEVPQAIAKPIEDVFKSKKAVLDAQKANLQAQFDRLSETYANQKRDLLHIEESINTIRESMRSQLDAEINRIEIATNLAQEKGNYDTLKEGYDKALEEITALEKQIETLKALKEIDKKGKKEFNAQIEKNKARITEIKAQLKTVDKDLTKAEKLLGGINKRIDSIEGIKKTKKIEKATDLASNQDSFEEFAFEDPVVEEPHIQEAPKVSSAQTGTETTARQSQKESSNRSSASTQVGSRRSGGSFTGRGKGESPRRPSQTTMGKIKSKAKSWVNKFFSLFG